MLFQKSLVQNLSIPIWSGKLFTRFRHNLAPRLEQRKSQKGRVKINTGGSIKGKYVAFGEYGLRLKSKGTRIAAKTLKDVERDLAAALRKIPGSKFWSRAVCNVAVCRKGNETRMGKGKGAFDFWASRVTTGTVIFEVAGPALHERMVRDLFRKLSRKLPGVYEFITKDTLPRLGCELVPFPEKVNYFKLLNKHPSKDWGVRQEAKKDHIKIYLRR